MFAQYSFGKVVDALKVFLASADGQPTGAEVMFYGPAWHRPMPVARLPRRSIDRGKIVRGGCTELRNLLDDLPQVLVALWQLVQRAVFVLAESRTPMRQQGPVIT